ncbi:MAG: inositol monophosphatase family protein [Rhodothermales bacterium]
MSEKTTQRYTRARDVAVQAAMDAGRLIAMHAGRLQEGQVREKATHDLVTEIDVASQALITRRLLDAFPESTVLGEEGTVLAEAAREVAGWRWIIDPVDGTTNFAHGVPPYAVSIGLQDEGKPVVGVVYEVSRDELFTAVTGQGLFVNGRPGRVSTHATLDQSLLVTGFPYTRFEHIDAFMDVLSRLLRASRGVRRTGSAATDLAYVACGRFDAFFESGLMPWDLAAGVVLIAEGGGMATNYYNVPERLFDRQIAATNGHIHHELLAILDAVKDLMP